MSSQAATVDVLEDSNYLAIKRGFWSWFTTTDHKRIGILYLMAILMSFLLGGFFALMIRAELLLPGSQLVTAATYSKLFTMHGAIMVFLVVIPGIPAALGNFMVPLMLGAPSLAFPRLNLTSFYLYLSGALLLILSLFLGGVDTGWTLYTPHSTTTDTAVLSAVAGAFLLGFSSIFTGLNMIVTIHKFKPKGMSWFKTPIFVWGIYATSVVHILATPVLGLTMALLFLERIVGIGIFDPALGGDPLLFQHFFWFYAHPAVYIMVLPAMAAMTEIITTFAKKTLFGYSYVVYSSIGLALLSFLVWGHHMFVSGQSPLANMIFSALTFVAAIPSAVIMFHWIATLYKSDIHLDSPMIYALMFILLFAIGALTGIFLGALNTSVHLHDTYFVVAYFHYTMMGAGLIGFFGALHYWWPKMTGRMYAEKPAKIMAVIVFFSFNLAFIPQFVMGARGMPRRNFDYDPRFELLHQTSSLGAFIMGVTLFLILLNLVISLKAGKKAPANPWGGTTLEWQTSSPPPLYNFPVGQPIRLPDLYEYESLVQDNETGGWSYKEDAASET
ncbi:MAG: cytochrome c oxidase subunit I [Myxococcales bacterium]|nr:cytochrome c oxidase subunit I [Myxococcales bacterium]